MSSPFNRGFVLPFSSRFRTIEYVTPFLTAAALLVPGGTTLPPATTTPPPVTTAPPTTIPPPTTPTDMQLVATFAVRAGWEAVLAGPGIVSAFAPGVVGAVGSFYLPSASGVTTAYVYVPNGSALPPGEQLFVPPWVGNQLTLFPFGDTGGCAAYFSVTPQINIHSAVTDLELSTLYVIAADSGPAAQNVSLQFGAFDGVLKSFTVSLSNLNAYAPLLKVSAYQLPILASNLLIVGAVELTCPVLFLNYVGAPKIIELVDTAAPPRVKLHLVQESPNAGDVGIEVHVPNAPTESPYKLIDWTGTATGAPTLNPVTVPAGWSLSFIPATGVTLHT